jgi:hypothetical protein
MMKKIYGYVGIIAILLMLIAPSIPAKKETPSSSDVYQSGWFILVSPDIRGLGLENGTHFGGIEDLNITIHGGNTFVLRTKPIWGSTMFSNYIDIHLQMANFFGFVDIYNRDGLYEGEIVGICKDVSWEKI